MSSKKIIIFILFIVSSICCFSAEVSLDESDNVTSSNIEFKNDSLSGDYNSFIKAILVLSFFSVVLVVALYFFKPMLLRGKDESNDKDRIKIIENKRMLNNLNLYLLEIDNNSVLLVKNGSSISTLKLNQLPSSQEKQVN